VAQPGEIIQTATGIGTSFSFRSETTSEYGVQAGLMRFDLVSFESLCILPGYPCNRGTKSTPHRLVGNICHAMAACTPPKSTLRGLSNPRPLLNAVHNSTIHLNLPVLSVLTSYRDLPSMPQRQPRLHLRKHLGSASCFAQCYPCFSRTGRRHHQSRHDPPASA